MNILLGVLCGLAGAFLTFKSLGSFYIEAQQRKGIEKPEGLDKKFRGIVFVMEAVAIALIGILSMQPVLPAVALVFATFVAARLCRGSQSIKLANAVTGFAAPMAIFIVFGIVNWIKGGWLRGNTLFAAVVAAFTVPIYFVLTYWRFDNIEEKPWSLGRCIAVVGASLAFLLVCVVVNFV